MNEKQVRILLVAMAVVALVAIAGMAVFGYGMFHNGQLVDQLMAERADLISWNQHLQEQVLDSDYTSLTVLENDSSKAIRYEALIPNDPDVAYVYIKVSKKEMKRLHENPDVNYVYFNQDDE